MALSSKMTRGRRARPSSRVAGWSAAPRASRRAPHALSHVQAVGVRASGTTTASGQHGRPALDDFAEVSTAARRVAPRVTSRMKKKMTPALRRRCLFFRGARRFPSREANHFPRPTRNARRAAHGRPRTKHLRPSAPIQKFRHGGPVRSIFGWFSDLPRKLRCRVPALAD